jgi:hypothetical protein
VRIRAFFVSCLTIAIVIFSRLASSAPILDSVLIDGREWAQPDLFLGADTFPGVSWNQINSECPAGVCGNTSELNGWHLSGWTWAGVDDVDGLFDHYAERFPEFYDPGLIPVWPDRLRAPGRWETVKRPSANDRFLRQTSVCSASSSASSTSTPRYRTVLSSFVCPRSNCTARRFFVLL